MMDTNKRLAFQQAKFHRGKVLQLENEYAIRQRAGEKKIEKIREDLKQELTRLTIQIADHKRKANEFSREAQTLES